MSIAVINLPIVYVADPDKGKPIFNGDIWIGIPGTDVADIPTNQKQAYAIDSTGVQVPINQPIKTSSGGVPIDGSGNVIRIGVDGDFSLRIDNSKGEQKYYFQSVYDGIPLLLEDLPQYVAAEFADVSDFENGGGALSTLNDITIDASNVESLVGRIVSCSYISVSSRNPSNRFVIKTAAQASTDGDVVDGLVNFNFFSTSYVAVLLGRFVLTGTLSQGTNTITLPAPWTTKNNISLIVDGIPQTFKVVSPSQIIVPGFYSSDVSYEVYLGRDPVQKIGAESYLLQYPSQFLDDGGGNEAPIITPNIYNTSNGYKTDYDPRSLKPTRDNFYYVNPDIGDDTNDGLTLATAFKTLNHCTTLAGDNEFNLEPGRYHYVNGTREGVFSSGVTIRCPLGKAELTNEALPRQWTPWPGHPGAYQCVNVVGTEDFGSVKTDIRFFSNPARGSENIGGNKLPLLASSGDVEGGEVGWFVGASVTILRMPDDAYPTNENLVIFYAKENLRISTDLSENHIYVENIIARYGLTNSILFETGSVDSTAVLLGCTADKALTDDAFEFTGDGLCVVWDCLSTNSFKDGFNYHISDQVGAEGAATVFEVNCESSFNGRQGTANNGSTFHNSIRGIRLNCKHNNSDNRNIQDINDVRSFNVGVEARHSGQDGFDDWVCGRDGTFDPTFMWLIGCEGGRVKAEAGATIYLECDTAYDSLTANGAVKPCNSVG